MSRGAADVFDKLAYKNNCHICREYPAYCAAERIENEAGGGKVSFAEFLCKRPDRKNTYSHRNTADNGNQHLRFAVVVGA